MREYNHKRDRHQTREYTHNVEGEYNDRARERESRENSNLSRVGKPSRVRVELKKKFNDPDKNFKEMLQEFRRRVSNAGIMHDFKDHQYYESKSEKRRKAKRNSQKKMLMDALTKRVVAGERIEGHGGLVKKIMSNLKKEKDKKDRKKERGHNRHHDD